jgi:hypothetical protein
LSSQKPVVNPLQCAILVPVAPQIAPGTEKGLRQLETMGYPVWRVYGFAAIDVARCRIATKALLEGFQELMWLDADIGFEPPAVERLRAHDLDFVAGVYPKLCFLPPGSAGRAQDHGRSVDPAVAYRRDDAADDLMGAILQPGERHVPGVDSVFAGW